MLDRTTTLDHYARQTLLRLLDRVQTEVDRTASNPDEDPVHDLRVSIRRFSQALRVYGHLLGSNTKQPRQRLRRRLKQALDAAGATRDLDVGIDLLIKEELPKDHPYLGVLRAERSRNAMALIGRLYLLKSDEFAARYRAIFHGPLMPCSETAADVARRELPPLAVDFFASGRKAAQRADSPQRLHAFRLAAKRFRYTLELDAPFYGPVFGRRIESVREIQSLLGKRQDCAVAAERIRPLAAEDPALAATLAKVEQRGHKLRDSFLDYWHQTFDGDGGELSFVRYLARLLPAPAAPKIDELT